MMKAPSPIPVLANPRARPRFLSNQFATTRENVTRNLPFGLLECTSTGMLRDRIEAHGGQMTVHSPAGGGTLLTARMPCV